MPGPRELPVPGRAPEEVHERAREILARAEFQPEPRSLLQRALDWALERLGDALGAVVGGGAVGVLGWLVVVALSVAVLVLVVRLLRSVGGDRQLSEAQGHDPLRPPEDWRAEADRHEANGQWKQALRCRYRALVASLSAAGLLEEVPGRTTGEYRDQLSGNLPSAAEDFGTATRLFEAAWYGDRAVHAEDNQRFRSMSDRVLASSRR